MTRPSIRRFASLLLASVLASLIGCASPDASSNAPRPGEGIAEYRQIVDDALKAMAAALHSLDRVSAHTDRCPARILAAFSKELERLEVDSIRVRARSQAIQARGDAYFENWQANLERVTDPRVRELAALHRPELQQRFANIKRNSGNTREVFKLFLSGLRKLQTTLEIDRASVGSDSTRDLIRSTREHGRQVEQGITAVGEELKAMASMLKPATAAERH